MFLLLFSCLLSGDPVDTESYSVEWAEIGYKKTMRGVRESSVRIVTLDDAGQERGHGSGGYFKYNNNRFILTAAHVIDTDSDVMVVDGDRKVKAKVLFIDFTSDIAIVKPETDLEHIKPKKWVTNKSSDKVGLSIVYAGFPSHYGKVLINGMVSSIVEGGVIAQSFALPGSSGSVVFDESGRVVGVVTAVGLHQHPFSPFPSMQENMVFIATVDVISHKRLMGVLECGK